MSDQDLRRDMSEVIDGTATPEQVARLQRALAADPAAAELFRQMREMDELLRGVSPETPPADLKPAILRAIRMQRNDVPGTSSWLESLKSAFLHRPALGYAYSFAAGVAMGALVLWLLPGIGPASRFTSPDRLSGTMIRDGQEVNNNQTISYAGGTIVVSTSPSTQGNDVRLSVKGPGAVDVTVRGVSSPDSVIRLQVKGVADARQQEIRLAAPAGN